MLETFTKTGVSKLTNADIDYRTYNLPKFHVVGSMGRVGIENGCGLEKRKQGNWVIMETKVQM